MKFLLIFFGLSIFHQRETSLIELKGHDRAVYHGEFSKDGKKVITSGIDGTTRIWNAKNGHLEMILKSHDASVFKSLFNKDTTIAVTAGFDQKIKVWDLKSGKILKTFTGENRGFRHVFLINDEKTIVAVDDESLILAWNLDTGKQLFKIVAHDDGIKSACISKSGNLLMTGSWDGDAKVWNLIHGNLIYTFDGFKWPPQSVKISDNEMVAAIGNSKPYATLCDLKTGKSFNSKVEFDSGVIATDFDKSSNYLALGSIDGLAKIYDINNKKELFVLRGHLGPVTNVLFSHSGKFLFTTGHDGRVMMWSVQTGKLIMNEGFHKESIRHISLCPNENKILTVGEDNLAKVYYYKDD